MTPLPPSRSQPPSLDRLLTRAQVIEELRKERGMLGLTAVAKRYELSPQQIADVLAIPPRARLSRRMYTKLRWKLWELFERLPE